MSDTGATHNGIPVPAVPCTAPHNCGQVDVAFAPLPDSTWGDWRGHWVSVSDSAPDPLCADHEHDLTVMHHTAGGHFCPTGFLWCDTCCGQAFEPPLFSCEVWQADEDPV